MKRRIVRLVAGLLVLCGVPGCFELEERIHLNNDGSGTIVEKLSLGPALVKLHEAEAAGQEAAPRPFADLYDEDKYKRRAKDYGEGVRFLKMEKVERDGAKGVVVTYRFDDINKVRFSPGSSVEGENGDGKEKGRPLTFAYDGETLGIKVPRMARGEAGGKQPVVPALEKIVLQMFKDMKLRAAITIEGGIAESNASHAEGETITILDLDFARILEDPRGAKAMQAVGGATRAELGAALQGVPGARIETRESLRVKVRAGR